MKKLSIYFVLVLLVLSGCKKYEEGPGISLRSKEKRLCQKWELSKATYNGMHQENDFAYYYWDIQKDGDFIVTMSYAWDGAYDQEIINLSWEWSSNKEEIELTEYYKDSKTLLSSIFRDHKSTKYSETVDVKIIKLKYKELIIEYTEEGDKYRMEFEQK